MVAAKRPLKNYSARLTTKPLDTIQEYLSLYAESVEFFYDSGQAIAIHFTMKVGGDTVRFRLPARVRAVEIHMYGTRKLTDAQKKQANVTAWANVRDWIIAQVTMIRTGMVTPEEVFLPYLLLNDGLTAYERMVKQQFLLTSGE